MSQLKKSDKTATGTESSREFSMSTDNFRFIRSLAYEITGISLSDHKQNMIYSRLARRLRHLGLDNFDQYCALLDQVDSPELDEFVNSITTNLTAFFREQHHFEFLKSSLLPHVLQTNAKSRRLRIWSAGCSTGEEPYSIAMVLKSFVGISNWDVKVLATDLDSNVVATAQTGIYALERAATVPAEYKKYVLQDRANDRAKIKDEVRNLITFKQLNLLQDWPFKGPFDLIFCRNVVIYFDVPTQTKLFDRYADVLAKSGHLFIGHSENLHKISDRFDNLGRTMYRRNR